MTNTTSPQSQSSNTAEIVAVCLMAGFGLYIFYKHQSYSKRKISELKSSNEKMLSSNRNKSGLRRYG